MAYVMQGKTGERQEMVMVQIVVTEGTMPVAEGYNSWCRGSSFHMKMHHG